MRQGLVPRLPERSILKVEVGNRVGNQKRRVRPINLTPWMSYGGRRQNIGLLLQNAGVLPRYQACSLDNFKGRLPASRPAFVCGPPGTGKTHLAVGYLREDVIANGEEHCRFIRTVDLLKKIRDSFDDRSGQSEKELLEYYGSKVPFLVLDDLGTEKVSDFVLQTLYDLLDRRYGECLDTLITSNLTLDDLAVYYRSHGDRLASRIVGMGPPLITQGEDQRCCQPKDRVEMRLRRILIEAKVFLKIVWWQGVRPSYRRQFWTQMIGMLRQNPTRFVEYIMTCGMGEDLFNMRRVVRDKATAIIRKRRLEVPAAPSRRSAALRDRLSAAPLEPSASRTGRD
jgi:hypothetical protein